MAGLGMAPPSSLYGFEDPFLSLSMNSLDELTEHQHQHPSKAPTSSNGGGTPPEGSLLTPPALPTHQTGVAGQKPVTALMAGRPPDPAAPYGDLPLLGIQPSMIQPDMVKVTPRRTDRASSSSARPSTGDQPRRKSSDSSPGSAISQESPDRSFLRSGSPAISSHGTPSSTMSIDLPRRDAHMASEQRRRAVMGQCFERLKQLLPPSEYRKPSKANVLQAVVNYLERLQRQECLLRNHIQGLQQENALLKHQANGSAIPFGMSGSSLGTQSRGSTLDNHPPIAPR